LWIITPSASADLLQTVGLKPAWKVWGQTLSPQWWEQHVWPQGVYLAAQQIPLGVVVLNELPEVRQTLTLRLMAKGQTLERAVTQLRALPEDDPLRDPVMNLLRSWAIIKDHPSELDPDEEEALMKIQYISYEDWKKELLQAGRLEGEQKGRLEGEQKGRLEGEQKGRLEGEQKGRLEGEQKGRLHQLEALLGLPLSSEELLASLPPTLVLERIQQLELRLRAMLHTPAA
jgi:flagellar biosynthesis/type III secretory pathway protein FliH